MERRERKKMKWKGERERNGKKHDVNNREEITMKPNEGRKLRKTVTVEWVVNNPWFKSTSQFFLSILSAQREREERERKEGEYFDTKYEDRGLEGERQLKKVSSPLKCIP